MSNLRLKVLLTLTNLRRVEIKSYCNLLKKKSITANPRRRKSQKRLSDESWLFLSNTYEKKLRKQLEFTTVNTRVKGVKVLMKTGLHR